MSKKLNKDEESVRRGKKGNKTTKSNKKGFKKNAKKLES